MQSSEINFTKMAGKRSTAQHGAGVLKIKKRSCSYIFINKE
jgi:hypothetical protein